MKTIIQDCSCAGFKKAIGIWFDSQDLQEGRHTKCPACKKPFKTVLDKTEVLAELKHLSKPEGK